MLTAPEVKGEIPPKKLTRKQKTCQHSYQKTLLGDYQCVYCNDITDKAQGAE